MNIMQPVPKAAAKQQHVIDVRDLDKKFIDAVFSRAETLGHMRNDSLKGKSLCWVAESASTRTGMSFKAAITQLGGAHDSLPDPEHSSESKGESFEDTIRVVGTYHDVIVIRSKDAAFPSNAAKLSSVPVINAGNGPDQHPTQALLDAFTVKQKLGTLEGLKIALVGDLSRGRAPRSLALLFAKHYPNNEFVGVGPEELWMDTDVVEYLKEQKVRYSEVKRLTDVIGEVDVVYMTRLQKEHPRKGLFGVEYPQLTLELAKKLDRHALIMHPLPANRERELPYSIDGLPQAIYLKDQLRAGLAVRKAILQELLL